MEFDLNRAEWISKPEKYAVKADSVEIITSPGTDLWQRTYYGFRNNNAPGFLIETVKHFTFTVRVSFDYKIMFDQCGILVYINSDNWMKAGLEYQNELFSRLGSVVTNNGYSDWATTDIENRNSLYLRLHRRGPDFLTEYSFNGTTYCQMRIFHLHVLGETTAETGRMELPYGSGESLRFGLFACSPGSSSFTAKFSEIELTECLWTAYK